MKTDRTASEIYAQELAHVTILSAEQEKELVIKYKKTGDLEARRRLVESCLRFIVRTAKSYSINTVKTAKFYGVTLEELQENLISAGNEGLLRGIERYDVTRGVRLLSYAAWHVLLAMREELHHVSTITVQRNRKKSIRKLYTASEAAKKELGRDATPEELSATTGLSLKQIDRLSRDHLRITNISDEISLSDPHSDIEQAQINKSGREMIENIIAQLPPRERFIISAYFGRLTAEPLSLKQISAVLGLSSERVRQIKLKTLAEIKEYLAYHGIKDLDDVLTCD